MAINGVTKRLHVLTVATIDGDCLKFGWKNEMQVVFTTKGIYISAMPSDKVPDWSEWVDKPEIKCEISEGSGHRWIAKPRLSFKGS